MKRFSNKLKTLLILVIALGGAAVVMTACTGATVITGVLGGGISLAGIVVLLLTLGLSQFGCRRTEEDTHVGICLSMELDDTDTETDSNDTDTGTNTSDVDTLDTDTADSDTLDVCLSIEPDTLDVCLSSPVDSESELGVCLDVVDTSYNDTEVRVCLDTEIGPCLSIEMPSTDSDSMLCLDPFDSESELSVCLSDWPDSEFEVCLEPPYEDTDVQFPDAGVDTEMGPCLSPPIDLEPCLSAPLDTDVDVCLSFVESNVNAEQLPGLESGFASYNPQVDPNVDSPSSRENMVATLAENGVLPKDIAARLSKKNFNRS